MPRIVVAGGGVIGMATGMMLAKEGCEVTVLERDGDALPGSPDAAWRAWDRHGVAQFRQPHFLHASGSRVLASARPEGAQAVNEADATRFDVVSLLPPFVEDRAPREGDDRFVTLTARRPVIEYAVASTARCQLDIRRGGAVAELLTGVSAAPGVPHVTGVRTSDGEELACDLVIDALGRRSELPRPIASM